MASRKAIDRVNERLAKKNLTLHPTKGFRKISAKRTAAAILAAEIKVGVAPFSMKLMRRTLRYV